MKNNIVLAITIKKVKLENQNELFAKNFAYAKIHLKSTVSIRFIDTGKRFTGKECQRNFNILFVNNLIKKTFPTHMTSTEIFLSIILFCISSRYKNCIQIQSNISDFERKYNKTNIHTQQLIG